MLGRTDRRLRHLGLLAVFVVMAVALSLRLAYWQVTQADDLRARAEARVSRPALEFIQRGDITDRRGTLLATTAYRDLLAAYPDLLAADQRAPVANALADLLGFDAEQRARLVETFEKGVPYAIVKRRLTIEESQRIRSAVAEGQLAALSLEPHPMRFYPNPGGAPRTTLASQLLGFVTEDGQGRYGIEQFNHDLLAGLDPSTATIDGGAPAATRAGQAVRLTIDASLQLRIEKELYAVWVADQAQSVSAVVMDPRTGELLAWASVPGYDANAYMQTAREAPDRFVDPVVSEVYEPGSVMKMVTAAAALELGVVRPETLLQDERALHFGSRTVRNADGRSMRELTFADVLAFSRNVPTAKVAAQLGRTNDEAAAALYDMWQRLGLGRASGVEVSSESRGIVADPAQAAWQPIDLANRSFGQGVAVTPLQLAVAYSTMVNGGYAVTPHVIDDGTGGAGALGPQVLDAEVSRTLRELMVHSVTRPADVAEKTLIDGYVVGGKTGTAQFWDSANGRWADHTFNYTFCGFVGDDPELVIVVSIQKPVLSVQGRHFMLPRITSYETFRRLAQASIAVLGIAPDHELPADEPQPSETPDPSEPTHEPVPSGAPASPLVGEDPVSEGALWENDDRP